MTCGLVVDSNFKAFDFRYPGSALCFVKAKAEKYVHNVKYKIRGCILRVLFPYETEVGEYCW